MWRIFLQMFSYMIFSWENVQMISSAQVWGMQFWRSFIQIVYVKTFSSNVFSIHFYPNVRRCRLLKSGWMQFGRNIVQIVNVKVFSSNVFLSVYSWENVRIWCRLLKSGLKESKEIDWLKCSLAKTPRLLQLCSVSRMGYWYNVIVYHGG
jgi:hypothetical protein